MLFLNALKTTLLLGLLTGVMVGAGWLIGGQNGMLIALGIAAVMNFASYWFSDKIVLAMYRGQQVSREQAPELWDTVAELARRAEIPMPRVYVIPQPIPNAFATGRNPKHAAVAVTEGLLQILNREELAGVIAHELGHVKNRDILVGSIAATLAGAVSMLANMATWALMFGGGSRDEEGGNPLSLVGAILAMFLAPFAAMLIQMAISRSREYLADRTGAELMGSGRPLASALRKLEMGTQRVQEFDEEHGQHRQRVEPATAHMFIVNPLSGRGLAGLFSTHPPIEERIRRLEAM